MERTPSQFEEGSLSCADSAVGVRDFWVVSDIILIEISWLVDLISRHSKLVELDVFPYEDFWRNCATYK